MKQFTFHVISLPHTQTTRAYTHCAYTEKVRKFCNMMMSLGHKVYLYASEDNEAECTELITCITKEQQKDLIGIEVPTDNLKAKFDPSAEYWRIMNANAIEGISERKQPKDYICLIAGLCQKPIADAFPQVISVEFGIGYGGVFSQYKVFESYAWMHTVYGSLMGAHAANGNNYDCVIPNYYETEDFPLGETKDDYFFFMGRLTERKGYNIAVEACKRLGKRLLIAGQGTPPEFGEYIGVLDPVKRGEVMSKAQAVFVPTQYIEPFGGVAVESMLCGTPIITSDYGAFTEYNIHGVTGFRCRTLGEYMEAMGLVNTLDYKAIREYAQANYSVERVKYMYQSYFDQLSTLWDDGWYSDRSFGLKRYGRSLS